MGYFHVEIKTWYGNGAFKSHIVSFKESRIPELIKFVNSQSRMLGLKGQPIDAETLSYIKALDHIYFGRNAKTNTQLGVFHQGALRLS